MTVRYEELAVPVDPEFARQLKARLDGQRGGQQGPREQSPAHVRGTRFPLDTDVTLVTRQAGSTYNRRRLVWASSAAASAVVIVGAGVVVISQDGGGPALDTVAPSHEWVVFAGDDSPLRLHPDGIVDQDIFAVREGSSARRVVGSDTDRFTQVCPELSPDGTRLVFGQAVGNDDDGYSDAALVIGNFSVDGHLTITDTIPISEASLPPCATWSADGRWLAIALEQNSNGQQPAGQSALEQVRVMDTQTGDTRRLAGLSVSDLEWAPDRIELAIAGNGLSIYSVETDQLRPLDDAAGAGTLTWSPDGQHIAYERYAGSSTFARELWLINADGSDARLIASGYSANHGIGPVWSPDGDHIVYQRLCELTPDETAEPCREQHEVVLLAVTDNDPHESAGTQRVLPPPRTTGPHGQPIWWYPIGVTWSRDGSSLIYYGGSSSGVLVLPLDSEKPPIVLYLEPSVGD